MHILSCDRKTDAFGKARNEDDRVKRTNDGACGELWRLRVKENKLTQLMKTPKRSKWRQ